MAKTHQITTLGWLVVLLIVVVPKWAAVQGFSNPTCRFRNTARMSMVPPDQQGSLQEKLQGITTSTNQSNIVPRETNKAKTEYSRDVILREEAESPFRKVRFWLYASLGAGAMTSLFISLARIAAALGGVNQDLMTESTTNAVIDAVGLVVLTFLYKNDLDAQESRYKRASKGAELAKLMIRASPSLLSSEESVSSSAAPFTTTLASMRRGRGIEKRVIIAAAGSEKMKEVLEEAVRWSDQLTLSDLVLVPVVLPTGSAPTIADMDKLPDCVALPVGNNWRDLVEDEAAEAREQGFNPVDDGFCIILKKNGKVGQRTKGVFLGRMVGDVTERREFGLDVSNI